MLHYECARQEIAECARIDEAAELRDKAAAIAAYARQRNDVELEVWFAEIRLRASIKIGELVGELDTAGAGRFNPSRHPDELTKTDAIEAAGLSRTDAYNCQQLAGGKKEAVASVAHKAAEAHFMQAREEKRPATIQSLRNAITDAVVNVLGPSPERPAVAARAPVDHTWTDFYAAIRPLAEGGPAQFDPVKLADAGQPILCDSYLSLAHGAVEVITLYINEMERRDHAAATPARPTIRCNLRR